MRYVGTSVRRVEDPRLLTGRGRFVADLAPAGLLHAYFLRSNPAHGVLRSIDATAARALNGVVLVLTGRDLEGVIGPLAPPESAGLRAPAHHALVTDRVRFSGDPIALIVASSRAVAEDAAELIEIDIDVLPALTTIDVALHPDAPTIFDDVAGNVLWMGAQAWGDVDAAFHDAAHVIRETFTQERHTCVPMECRGGLAEYDAGRGELRYTVSHQNPHAMRMHLASILAMPATRITVLAGDIGGSFGLKSHPAREDVAVCHAARLLGRPVAWIEDRAESFLAAGHARDESLDVEAAVDAEGLLIGLRARLTMDHGAYPLLNIPLNLFANIVKVLLPGSLRLVNYAFEGRVIATNKASYVAYRGPWEIECWGRERLLDRIAHELGIDPVDVRRRNLLPEDAYPCPMLTGATLDHMTINRTLEEAVRQADYAAQRAAQLEARAAGALMGIGVCTYLEPGPGPTDYAQALGFTYEQRSMQRARVRLEIDGSVTVFTSQQPHGQGHETTLAQLAADELGLAIDRVRVVHGNTELQPFNLVATGGSRAATLASGAVVGAARIVRDRIAAVVADLLEASADDLELVDGVARVKGSPTRSRSLADVARLSVLAPFTLSSKLGDGLDVSFDFETPDGGWTQSTHICTVSIDPDTAEVTIVRYVVVEDCGRMINPAVVDGQIRGGIAQGIGSVLLERIVYDDAGQNRTTTLQDYLVPTALDVPLIEIHHLQGADQGLIPYRGVGEGGAIGAPAAVTNAIEDALWHLGARVRTQHLPPSHILDWIR